MSNAPLPDPRTDPSWKAWLMQEVTVTLPRWAYVAAAGAALVLLLIALD